MKLMRSTLAFALIWINLISIGLILFFYFQITKESFDLNFIILILDSESIIFIFLLTLSFFMNKNECCTSDIETSVGFEIGSCYGTYTCFDKCTKNKGESKCKHISRIISVIFLVLINIALVIIGFISGNDIYHYLIIVFSLISALSNLLGLILPNLLICKKLSHQYIASLYIQYQQCNYEQPFA